MISGNRHNHYGLTWAHKIQAQAQRQMPPGFKIIPQHVIDYHMRTKGRLPDMIRRQVDLQRSFAVPENLKADASRYLKKSVYGRKRRSFDRSYSSYQPLYQPNENIFELLTKIRQSKGASTSADEAGFLTKKNGIVLLKCAPQRYKTAIPSSVDRLNPSLLAQILQERRGPMPVKRSRFANFG